MAEASSNGWSTWALSTKITVSVGVALACALVVVLYLPR